MGATPTWWGVVGLVALPLLGEAWLSGRHTRRLRAAGAVEPPDDVYPWLGLAYVGGFLAMAGEGWGRGTVMNRAWLIGLTTFVVAKALKYAAIAALGERWSFRILVLPGRPLVASGPYRWLDHPNYVAVAGELMGAACLFAAPATGVLATATVVLLLRRRIAVEEAALGRAAPGAQQPVGNVPRRTAGADAPGSHGARSEDAGKGCATSPTAGRDAAAPDGGTLVARPSGRRSPL